MARILLAEDNLAIATVLEHHLKSRGHQIRVVHDGVAASVQGQDIQPDLIITDIQMPGAYGTNAYKILETAGVTKHTPVIFITSVNLEQAKKIVPATPLTRLLPKPVDLGQLDAAMVELLQLEPPKPRL